MKTSVSIGAKTVNTLKDTTPNSNGSEMLEKKEFVLQLLKGKSFKFEMWATVILLMFLFYIRKWNQRYLSFEVDDMQPDSEETKQAYEKRAQLKLIRCHESKKEFTEYDSDNEVNSGISSKEKKQKEQLKERQQSYDVLMRRLKSGLPIIYFESYSFLSSSQAFFALVIVCQIIQAMGFNGMIDIPSLFMILLLFAIYTYRKNFPVYYAQATMAFIYW